LRESLTVLAILLILLFTAALAGPYFIDWSAERAIIEKQLSELVGAPVKVEGAIDLRLLPTPYLTLQRVGLANQGGPFDMQAERLRLEVAVAPLLRGELDFTEATLQRPRLRLTLSPDGAVVPLGAKPAFAPQLRFERIAVEDGTLELRDPATGRDVALGDIGLTAQADALTGPFRGDGAVRLGSGRTAFRFTTSEFANDRLRLKLIVDATAASPRVDVDGTFATPSGKGGATTFAGTAILSGRWTPRGFDTALPWRVAAQMRGTARALHADSLELRLGDEEHALSFPGTADIDLSGTPKATASLKARQLDLDRALGRENGPPPLVRAAQLFDALTADSRLSAETVPLSLDWTAESILVGGETVTDVAGALRFEEDRPPRFSFEASGPGRSHLKLDGDVETGSAAEFNGMVALSAGDLDRVAAWLGPVLPPGLPRPLPVRRAEVTGRAVVSRVGVAGHDLALRLDRSALTGTLAYTKAVGADPPRLFADVAASALDLDGLPDPGAATRALGALDLSISFSAQAIAVAGLAAQPVAVDRIRLDLTKSAGLLRLRDFDILGLGGASLHAKGSWDGDAVEVQATVDADRLQNTADFLRRLAPNPVSTFVARQAPALSPAHLAFSARARAGANGSAPDIAALLLDGSLGATQLAMRVGPDAQAPGALEGTIRVDAADSLALLRQAGVSVLPLAGAGPGRIAMTAHGTLAGRLDASLSATLAGASFGYAGSLAEGSEPHVSGAVKLSSGDLLPLLQASAFAFPDATARLPAELAGAVAWTPQGLAVSGLSGSIAATPVRGALQLGVDGRGRPTVGGDLAVDHLALATLVALALGAPQPAKAGTLWSNLPFASGLADPPATTLALKVAAFDLPFGMVGHDADFRVEIAPGVVALKGFSAALQPGRVVGDLTLRRDGRTAAVEGHAAMEDYPIALPNAQGRLKAALEIAGSGGSALALVSSLAGSGPAQIADLTLPRADPAALARVFAMAEDDRLTIDEAEVARTLRREFDKGALKVGDRSFDLGLAAGQLRFVPTTAAKPDGGAATTVAASIDLRDGSVEERVGLTQTALPRDWTGPPPRVGLLFKGPIAAPNVSLDVANFINALATRAIARESARIQSYESDIRERAFFNQRLQSERRREQERVKAIEDARRAAEALRLRQAEEARQKAEDARRAAEPAVPPAPAPTQLPGAVTAPRPGAPAPAAPLVPDPSAAGRY
jgi:hypothetical protein